MTGNVIARSETTNWQVAEGREPSGVESSDGSAHASFLTMPNTICKAFGQNDRDENSQ